MAETVVPIPTVARVGTGEGWWGRHAGPTLVAIGLTVDAVVGWWWIGQITDRTSVTGIPKAAHTGVTADALGIKGWRWWRHLKGILPGKAIEGDLLIVLQVFATE